MTLTVPGPTSWSGLVTLPRFSTKIGRGLPPSGPVPRKAASPPLWIVPAYTTPVGGTLARSRSTAARAAAVSAMAFAVAGSVTRAIRPRAPSSACRGRGCSLARGVAVGQVRLPPADRGLDRVERRHRRPGGEVLAGRVEHLQLGEGEDVVVLPRGQPRRRDADVAALRPFAGKGCAATPGFGTSAAVWSATSATLALNAGSSDTSTLNRTGKPNPAPMSLKSSWQPQRTTRSRATDFPRSTCTHFAASGFAASPLW